MSPSLDGGPFRREVPVGALAPAEVAFAVRQLSATAPHVRALARLVHRDDFWRLCCAEFTGVDVRVGGWDIRGRWFAVVVTAPSTQGQPRRTGTIEWRTVALHIARAAGR